MKPYFTLRNAQRETAIIPQYLNDTNLQKHIVKLIDFKRYIDYSDRERLVMGGYYARVMDCSASGFVPKDIWLQTNLGQALDEALKERNKRQEEYKVMELEVQDAE